MKLPKREQLRSVALIRVMESDPLEPSYRPLMLPDAKPARVDMLAKALMGKFDILVLHDPSGDCKMATLIGGKCDVSKLPCQIHNRPTEEVKRAD